MPAPHFPETLADLMAPAEAASIAGIDLVLGMMEGRYPAAPIAKLARLAMTGVKPGEVVFEGVPDFSHYNPQGTVHGGWFGTALDSAMGCAVMSTLPRGQSYTTLEYKINMLRPAFANTGVLRVVGTSIHTGRRTATAEGRIVDGAGKLYATGTTTCLVLAIGAAQA